MKFTGNANIDKKVTEASALIGWATICTGIAIGTNKLTKLIRTKLTEKKTQQSSESIDEPDKE